MDKLLSADISHGDYETYVPMLAEKFADVSKEDVLKRVAAMEFDRFLKYYEHAEDLNVRERDRTERGKREERGPEMGRRREERSRDGARGDSRGEARGEARTEFSRGAAGYSRLFVNLGTKDGFFKASFLQYVLDMSDLKKEVLGKIDMRDMNSWIEIEKGAAQQMIRALDGKKYKGRSIRMNDADSGGPAGFSSDRSRRPRRGE